MRLQLYTEGPLKCDWGISTDGISDIYHQLNKGMSQGVTTIR